MNNPEEEPARLKFFKSAILDFRPQIEGPGINSGVGMIEAAHWARLGVQIGYFGKEDARRLISSENMFAAWSTLEERQIISPEDAWVSVIRRETSGGLVLDEAFFYAPYLPKPYLFQLFQMFLLLTSESIVNVYSDYFLDAIGWTDEEEWNRRRHGWGTFRLPHALETVHGQLGPAQIIGIGFANVMNYWDEMDSSARSALGGGSFLVEHERQVRTFFVGNRPELVLNRPEVEILIDYVRVILNRRFNLGRAEIMDRYFVLAGEFSNRAREDSPSWLDAQPTVFEKLVSLVMFASRRDDVDRTRLWSAFTKGIEESHRENEINRTEASRRERPKEFL